MAWIRSQNKTKLLDVDNIRITHYAKETTYDIVTSPSSLEYIKLGTYSTEKKALKVMDMLQKTIIQNETVYAHIFKETGVKNYNIFQMPADEEV